MDKTSVTISLSATLAVQSLAAMAAVTVPVFTPIAAREIGISPTYVGIYVALMYITGMMSSLWSGAFIIRYGAIRISQFSLGLCAFGVALTALGDISLFVVSALILGLGYGPMTPASSHILSRNTPQHLLSFVFSLKQTSVPLGGAMAAALVPPLVLLYGWQNSAMIMGILCLAVAILVQPVRSRLDRDRLTGRPLSFQAVTQPLKMVLSHRPFMKLAITSMIFSGMQLCLITYLVIYLTNNVGISLVTAGLTLSAAQTVSMLARILWGLFADRYIKPRLMLGILGIAMSLGAIATALFSPGWPYVGILVVSILYGATANGWNGVYLAEVARLAPEGKVGIVTGGTLFFTFLGIVIGPPLFGAVVAGTDSYSFAFVAVAILTLACGTVLIFSKEGSVADSYSSKG
jgi:MFS family permease